MKAIVYITLMAASIASAQQTLLLSGTPALHFSNPAIASADDRIYFSTVHRKGWSAADAPELSGATIHVPFSFFRFGWGATVLNESAPNLRKASLAGDFSYKIKLREKMYLAAGARLGLSQWSQEIAPEKIRDAGDPLAGATVLNPIVGLGGNLNLPNGNIMLDANMNSGLYSGTSIQPKFYYSLAANRKFGKQKFVLEPLLHIRYSKGFRPIASAWMTTCWNRLLYAGIGGRSNGSLSATTGLNTFAFTGLDLAIRYYFEYNTGKILPGNNGHEIQLILRIRKTETLTNVQNRKTTVSPLQFE